MIESSGNRAVPSRSVIAQLLMSIDSGCGLPTSTKSSSRAGFAYTRTRRASGCGASEKGAEAGRGRGRSGSASLSAQRGEDARTSAANKAARARPRARTIRWTFPAVHKGAAYRHATSGGRAGISDEERLGNEELALADDRLAVHFDGRASDRVLEPERRLVVPAGEIIPADSDGDGPADDGVLQESERGLRVGPDRHGGNYVLVP